MLYPGGPCGSGSEGASSSSSSSTTTTTGSTGGFVPATTGRRRRRGNHTAGDGDGDGDVTLDRRQENNRNARVVMNKRHGGKSRRATTCLVIATSDASIKFHEVWSEGPGGRGAGVGGGGGRMGALGGSDILEALAGVEKEGREVIR